MFAVIGMAAAINLTLIACAEIKYKGEHQKLAELASKGASDAFSFTILLLGILIFSH